MKITDKYILKIFYTKNGKGPLNIQNKRKLNNNILIISKEIDQQIKKYLNNRFIDSKSIQETLFRIKYKIEVRPHCATPGCTNDVAFNGTKKKPYMLHCSCTCTQLDKTVRDKQANTCLKLYGCINGAQSQQAKEKYQKHMEEKYGIGVKNAWQAEEVKEKLKQTLLQKYGVDNIAKTQQCKDKHKACEKETVAKRNITKKLRGTFNTSRQEEICYNLLIEKFGIDDVKRQYKSDKYPFQCDFYIVSKDLYIEYNGLWTHGKHAFNEKNKDDLLLVTKWKSKNTKYYDIAINTWTKRDVNKRNIAKQNMINYKEFWNIKDFKQYLKGDILNK